MIQLVKREIFDEIAQHLLEKEVTVITGARQTGKTTILNQLKNWLVDTRKVNGSQIKSFNLDLVSDLEGVKNQSDFIKFLKEELKEEKFIFVFIDEIQRLDNPGKFLKGIYDLSLLIKLIVTRSSSLEIKSKVFESLAGRKRIFHIWPFSFREYLSWHQPSLLSVLAQREISSLNKGKIFDYFFDFIIFGGYPRVALAKNHHEKVRILEELYSSYIEKDIIALMHVKNPLGFSQLATMLAGQIGNLLNQQEISNTLGLNIRTVESYLYALENTFVLGRLRPYFSNTRKELTKMPKIYFVDNGLRNLTVKYFSSFQGNRDKGELLENFIYSSLLKKWQGKINYWRTKDKNEVDFILQDYYGHVMAVEVKAIELKKAEVARSLHSFIEKYSPRKVLVVNLSLETQIKINDTNVEFILPFNLIDRVI